MKHPKIEFRTIVPAEDVLNEFLATGKKTAPAIALVACRSIVERLVKERAKEMIRPKIMECVELNEFENGTPAAVDETQRPPDMEMWTDEMDTRIEALLDSYSLSVTQDFIGRYCVSTRFHLPVAQGAKREADVLAEAFAKDVWRVLMHAADEDEPTRQLTTEELLAAVGIGKSDLIEIMGDMSETAPQPKEDTPMDHNDTNAVLNKMHDFWGGDYPENLQELYEMATDNDEVLALSGCVPLGLEVEDGRTLRKAFVKNFGEFETALRAAPYDMDGNEPDLTGSQTDDVEGALLEAGETDDEEEQDPDMREMMGLPPLPAASSASPPPAAPKPLAPQSVASAAPAAASGLVGGPVDKKVFAIIRQHVKVKDEDIATGIGVSRQTFINYGDPKKTANFVGTAEHKAFLLNMITTSEAALAEARTMLGG